MVLTTLSEAQAPEEARQLMTRAKQETSTQSGRAIIEMVVTIISYKFIDLNREEIGAMLGFTLKETGVYKDINQEVLEEARLETADMVIALLDKRFGSIAEDRRTVIKDLSAPMLKTLNLAVLDFSTVDDLAQWLADHPSNSTK